jgi:hypothetical protein
VLWCKVLVNRCVMLQSVGQYMCYGAKCWSIAVLCCKVLINRCVLLQSVGQYMYYGAKYWSVNVVWCKMVKNCDMVNKFWPIEVI